MSRVAKLLLGCVTILPLASVFIIPLVGQYAAISVDQNTFWGRYFISFLFLALCMLMIFLVVGYEFFLFRRLPIEKKKKNFWAVVLFLGNLWAMPIFWYLYVWRNAAQTAKATP